MFGSCVFKTCIRVESKPQRDETTIMVTLRAYFEAFRAPADVKCAYEENQQHKIQQQKICNYFSQKERKFLIQKQTSFFFRRPWSRLANQTLGKRPPSVGDEPRTDGHRGRASSPQEAVAQVSGEDLSYSVRSGMYTMGSIQNGRFLTSSCKDCFNSSIAGSNTFLDYVSKGNLSKIRNRFTISSRIVNILCFFPFRNFLPDLKISFKMERQSERKIYST